VQAPPEIVDQAGAWSLKTVGQDDGYKIEILSKWLEKIVRCSY